MHDQALALLLQQWQHTTQQGHNLWFADENSHAILPILAAHSARTSVITNRYDVHQATVQQGINSIFNDVDFSAYPIPPTHIYIRISKEKPVTHHSINQAASLLGEHGFLHLAGYKNEGIKTYAQKALALFGNASKLHKQKDAHIVHLSQPQNCTPLDTQNYTQLRTIGHYKNIALMSKPGVFGFEKLDEGSLLLLESAEEFLTANQHQPIKQLDLGCGYGLLTFGSAHWGAEQLTATDNNAAALAATQATSAANQIPVHIIAADAGQSVAGKYDTILCNPPFHQGFDISADLTDKFLRSASQKLAPKGIAFFVVNSFIGLEKKAAPYFGQQQLLVNNHKFKVLALQQPKH